MVWLKQPLKAVNIQRAKKIKIIHIEVYMYYDYNINSICVTILFKIM